MPQPEPPVITGMQVLGLERHAGAIHLNVVIWVWEINRKVQCKCGGKKKERKRKGKEKEIEGRGKERNYFL